MTVDLNKLQKEDLYSFVLFALYKLMGNKQYSSISQLAYVLDLQDFLKLCEYFGGQTLYIPKVDEMEELIVALLLYQHINIEHLDFDSAVEKLPPVANISRIKNLYREIAEYLRGVEYNNAK